MFDLENLQADCLYGTNWKDFARQSLAGLVGDLARLVDPGHAQSDVRLGLIKAGRNACSFELTVGRVRAHLKLFGAAQEARTAYNRERTVHAALQRKGLSADMIAYSDTVPFILTKQVAALSWDQAVQRFDPADLAWEIGAWQALFDHEMPVMPASGNWFGYLARVWPELPLNAVDGARDALSGIPL
jgi:hypothetical protein